MQSVSSTQRSSRFLFVSGDGRRADIVVPASLAPAGAFREAVARLSRRQVLELADCHVRFAPNVASARQALREGASDALVLIAAGSADGLVAAYAALKQLSDASREIITGVVWVDGASDAAVDDLTARLAAACTRFLHLTPRELCASARREFAPVGDTTSAASLRLRAALGLAPPPPTGVWSRIADVLL